MLSLGFSMSLTPYRLTHICQGDSGGICAELSHDLKEWVSAVTSVGVA